MDNRPVGVFDSGLGGLTAVKELTALLPGESIIYLGDTGRVPYGTRSKETIVKYTAQAVSFLKKKGVKHIIIACGTASSTALEDADFDKRLCMGVVRPAAEAAAAATKNKKIAVIATKATIRSKAYERHLAELLPDASVYSAACPLLVPLVEAGRFRKGDALAEIAVAEYLKPVKDAGVDTLILGCTHYPLLREIIAAYMGNAVALIDAGATVARAAAEALKKNDSLSATGGDIKYYVTDSEENFQAAAEMFLQCPVSGSVEKVDVERLEE